MVCTGLSLDFIWKCIMQIAHMNPTWFCLVTYGSRTPQTGISRGVWVRQGLKPKNDLWGYGYFRKTTLGLETEPSM